MASMERIQSINPDRIAWCCADHGIAPSDLALELSIAPASIERTLAGGEGVTFNQLRKIAEYFNRGILFFLEPGPVDEERAHTPQFRTLANQKPELSAKLKALIERVEKQRLVYLSLREDLDDTDRPSFAPPNFPRSEPQEVAQVARKWLGLADENSFDTYRAAVEARGVLVFRSNGYNGKWQIAKESPILGFTLYDELLRSYLGSPGSRSRLRTNWDTCSCTNPVRSMTRKTCSPTKVTSVRPMLSRAIYWCLMLF